MKPISLLLLAIFLTTIACNAVAARHYDALLKQIENLAQQADRCKATKDANSEACMQFATALNQGGMSNIELFKNKMSAIIEQDADAGIEASKHMLRIGQAAVVLTKGR
ncbi:hypothetical protein HHX48_13275 [Salinimonas sp. HHU 13199]|uniref:UrcA family protein n=1 Tax=Salinimonas profundi TaxID=2729140 RepID=A0ABR8LKI3_9ALTE|nr:hypothetical protein [Salinimonas profundi]MBD3586713.1 hypothetical protein [Salinimonas profundi]